MSVVLTTDPAGIVRTSGLVPATSDQAFEFDMYFGSVPSVGQHATLFYYGDDPTTLYTDVIAAYWRNDGKIDFNVGVNTITVTPGSTTNKFHTIGYTREGATHKFYFDGKLWATDTLDISAWTATHFYLGTDTFATETQPTKLQYFREWPFVITQDDLLTDAQTPGVIAGATCDTPLVADLLDDSGNGHDWAMYNQVAAYTASPFNVTWLRAATIGASVSQNAHIDGVTYTLWFKHPPARSGMFSVFGVSSGQETPPTGYHPRTSSLKLLNYVPTTISYPENVSAHGPSQQYFELGALYYLRVEHDVDGNYTDQHPTPADLLLTIVSSPTLSYAIGDLLSTEGHDMTAFGQYWGSPILNPTTGVVKQIRAPQFGGSFGDAMPVTGEWCLSNQHNGTVKCYDHCFRETLSLGANRAVVRTSAAQRMFYIWYGTGNTTRTVKKIAPEGVVVQTWTVDVTGKAVGSAPAFAVANDGTVLYVGSGNLGVLRYDLVGEAWLTKLADRLDAPALWFSDYGVGLTMLVMADDSILVTEEDAQESSAPGVQFFWKVVLQYEDTGAGSPTGNLLNRWDFPGRQAIADRFACRLSYSLDDPGTFWFMQDDPTQPRMYVTAGEYPTTVPGVSLVAPTPIRTWTRQAFQFGSLEYEGGDNLAADDFLNDNPPPLDSPRSGPPLAPNLVVIRRVAGCQQLQDGVLGPLLRIAMPRRVVT